MSYEQVKDLPPAQFKRYCGVRPETFRRMVEVVSNHLRRKRRVSGRPTKLSVEDQVLMTLEYWREPTSHLHGAGARPDPRLRPLQAEPGRAAREP